MQTKKNSLAEAILNGAIAYAISVMTASVVFPWFGVETSLHENMGITACFTLVTVTRSYVIRRWFNRNNTL